jgi:hypothetical protein
MSVPDLVQGVEKLQALWGILCSCAVNVSESDKVQSYLDRHSDLLNALEGICEAARREFGTEAVLTLQVYCDPEIKDEYLLLSVRLHAYGTDTMRRIRSLSEPFETELSDKSGSIVVTAEFQPSR